MAKEGRVAVNNGLDLRFKGGWINGSTLVSKNNSRHVGKWKYVWIETLMLNTTAKVLALLI